MGMPQPQQQHQLGGQQQHHRGGGRGRGGQLRHGGSGFMASQGSGSGLGDLVAGMQGEVPGQEKCCAVTRRQGLHLSHSPVSVVHRRWVAL
jgi:hypothetical protein